MNQSQKPSLGREILFVLIVKVVLIFALWWVFFRAPDMLPPTAEAVSRALLDSGPAVVKPGSNE